MKRALGFDRPRAAFGQLFFGDRLHLRDDRRRRHAAGHQHHALPAAHHRRDQWESADRAMTWILHRIRHDKGRMPPEKKREEGAAPRVNILGPMYGTFNIASPNLHEIRQAGRRHRRHGQHGDAAGQPPGRNAQPGERRRQHLHVPRVRPRPVRGSGQALPFQGAHRGGKHSRSSLRKLGELTGLDPEPFIEREKHSTIKPALDLWRSSRQDFFATARALASCERATPAACASSSKPTWACLAPSPSRASPGARPTTTEVRSDDSTPNALWS